jgi:predicted nuclease of predicted toxin-antitoxin system
MRLLLDSCVWGPAAEELRAAGHDVCCIHDLPVDPGDEEVLRESVTADRVLITLDKDFGELVFVLGHTHRGILRLVNIRARDQGRTVLGVLARHGRDLEKGAIVVVLTDRIRVRAPEEGT